MTKQGYMRFLFVVILYTTLFLPVSHSQTNTSSSTSLFDGQTLNSWSVVNSTADNFYVQDQMLRVEGPEGWIRSQNEYSDFILNTELRFLTDDADSGIFIRVSGDTPFFRGWPGNSYQIQARDMSLNQTENPIWFGDIYRHRIADGETNFDRERAFELYTETGEWQSLEIQAVSDSVVVRLNGVHITTAKNIVNPAGFIGIQGEAGIIEFRSITIREL